MFTVTVSLSHCFIFGRRIMWAVEIKQWLFTSALCGWALQHDPIVFDQSDFYILFSELGTAALTSWNTCKLSRMLNVFQIHLDGSAM